MPDSTGTVLALMGYYLSLIGILASLFYIHIGTWFRQISSTRQKWAKYKNLTDPNAREKHIECYLQASDEKSLQPLVIFLLLTIFMIMIGFFAFKLRPLLPEENNLPSYVYYPGCAFFGLYIVVSLTYLIWGYCRVGKLYKEIDNKLRAN